MPVDGESRGEARHELASLAQSDQLADDRQGTRRAPDRQVPADLKALAAERPDRGAAETQPRELSCIKEVGALEVFGQPGDARLDTLGFNFEQDRAGRWIFAVENHLPRHLKELSIEIGHIHHLDTKQGRRLAGMYRKMAHFADGWQGKEQQSRAKS